jgi:uncharacterized protein (UPF0210 family)
MFKLISPYNENNDKHKISSAKKYRGSYTKASGRRGCQFILKRLNVTPTSHQTDSTRKNSRRSKLIPYW